MAVLRLASGTDVPVKVSVADAIAAIRNAKAADVFIEFPGEDGSIHLRPSGVLAIVDDAPHGRAGFRVDSSG